jgi:NAD-dependent DNA ligase
VVDGGAVLVEAVIAVVVERANARSKAITRHVYCVLCPHMASARAGEACNRCRAGNACAPKNGGERMLGTK